MATLIQSKQIQGIVTASVIEGDFKVASGSVDLTTAAGVTGSFSGSFVGDGTGLTINYSQLQGKPTIIGGIGIDVNQVGDTITITNTGGSGGDSLTSAALNSISDLNAYTASNDIIISGLNQATASLQSQIDNISVDTSSLAKLDSSNIFSGTQYFSGSLIPESSNTDDGIHSLGSATNPWKEIFISTASLNFVESEGVVRKLSLSDLLTLDSYPHEYSGLISSSQQISDLGFITSSQTVDLTQVNQFTQSIDSRVTALENATDLTGSDSQTLSVNGNQITISGGNTITIPTGSSGNHTDITSLNQFTSSFSSSVASDIDTLNQALTQRIDSVEQSQVSRIDSLETFTQSIDARVSALESQPDLTGSDSQTLSIVGDQLTIAGGNTITIPTGSSGGHTDITALNQFTASYATDSASFDSRLSGIIETGSVIAPFAFGFVNNTTNGSGTGISWGNWNSSNSSLDFTFTTAQPDTNYAVITDSETFDNYFVGISNKTTTGFRAEFYDNSQSRTPSSFSPFNFIVYGSNPTQSVRVNVTSPDVTLLNTFTGSADSRLSSLETTTSSLQSQIDALISATSSYSTTDLTGSDSQTLSVVGDQLTISGGNTITIPTGSNVTLPSGLISSSQQITDLGFIDSAHTDVTQLNQFTQSIQSQVDSLTNATSSYLTSLPSGLVSGSTQITDGSGIVSGSVIRTFDGTDIFSGSLVAGTNITINQVGDNFEISSSASGGSASVTVSDSAPGSPSEGDLWWKSDDGNLYIYYDGYWVISTDITTGLPAGVVSGSAQITSVITDSYISASVASSGFGSGGTSDFTQLTNVPSGLVSSSTQITDGSGIVSGSVLRSLDGTDVVSGSVLRTLDGTNVISSSQQLIDLGFSTTDLTGSDSQTLSIVGDQLTLSGGNTITIPTGSDLPSGLITSSQQISDLGYVTSSLEASFDGDRIVSNTLLGDLYTGGYNAGTSGSLADFIEQVFFPTTAPTATFTNQTSKFNTNLATNNTNLVSVSLTDTVDNSPYTLVLSGTNASSLSAVPTNSASSSWEIRANGNLSAGTYSYDVTVGDSTNAERTYSGRSITIAQADTGTLSTNGTLYIIESATSGVITLSSSGIPGSTGAVSVSYSPNYGSQVATNFTSSNPLISVNSTNGQLSVGSPISGSGNLAGSTITSTITYEDQYGNQGTGDISVTVTQNNAPSIIETNNTSNLNTNLAVSGALLCTISFNDLEGDAIDYNSFTFQDASNKLVATRDGSVYRVRPNTNLEAATYAFVSSIKDVHGFNTTTEVHSFTVSAVDNGTLTGDSSIYIVESAVSGDSFRDATGYNNGNLANISVSYSPNYGSQVATISSSNPAIVVDGSGNLTLGIDLSGSVTQSGDSFTSLISWTDQYGNSDSSTITATVFGNQSPSATFTDNGLGQANAVNGANIGSLSITDTESNSPFQVTIGGTDGSKFNLVPQNAASSSWEVQPNQSLTIGTYSVQFTVVDSYGEQSILNETISVSSDSDYGKVYVYTSTRTGGGTLSAGNYLAIMGASAVDSSTPPLVTTYTADTTSPFYKIKSGDLGNSTITVGGGQMNLRSEVSGSDLNTIISSSFSAGGTTEQILVIFPSGSDMVGTPTSMTDATGGSTNGEYVMFVKGGGDTSFGSETSTIHGIELDSAHEGYSTWYVVGRTGTNADNSYEVQIIPSSGSAPA